MRTYIGFAITVLFAVVMKSQAQVSLQTGGATFSLPIFNWQDDKSKLTGIIALNYGSGNGLRVSEVASNVGQGWNLLSGGMITRMQVGQPDDQVANPGIGDDDVRKYPPGILYATVPVSQGCPIGLTKYPIYGDKNQVYAQHNAVAEDKELDYFSFQFNGKSGMFVLDPTNVGTAHSLGDTRIKITFQQDGDLQSQGIRTKITSFIIQDEDGVKYKFAKHGLTKILQSNYCDEKLIQAHNQPKFKDAHVYHQAGFDNATFTNPYVIGSWYLSEIEDPLTFRKVLFNYHMRNIDSRAGEDVMHNRDKNYTIIYHKRSVTKTPVISSIIYPDGHAANFNYGDDRIDLIGEKSVSSIDVTYNGRYLSRHELKLSYVILNRYGHPVSDYEKSCARLFLTSVKKIGPDLTEDSPPYIFDYNLGSNTQYDFVPPPFFYAKDIWGYYNGNNSKSWHGDNILLTKKTINQLTNGELLGLCFLRNGSSEVQLNAKTGYAKNGLLRQIIFPTGGTLSYEYEQNMASINGTTTNVGGVHVSQTNSTDGGHSNGCTNPIITKYGYVLEGV